MSQHDYVLTYFDISGRAELSRLLFHYANVPFKDVRFKFEEWDSIASNYEPYRRLPMLEIDGKVKITQSLAIGRYLAREFGLDGKTNVEKALADSIVETCNELFNDLMTVLWQSFKDEDIAVQSAGTLLVGEGPRLLNHIEQILKQNGGPFLTGKDLTWADLALLDISTKVKVVYGHFDFAHPTLKQVVDLVSNSKPELAAYLAKRPVDQLEHLENFGKKRIADGHPPSMFGVLYTTEH